LPRRDGSNFTTAATAGNKASGTSQVVSNSTICFCFQPCDHTMAATVRMLHVRSSNGIACWLRLDPGAVS
jgi:hypothetical protein